MSFTYLDSAPDISEMEKLLLGDDLAGPLRVVPADFYASYRYSQLVYFGHKHAYYQFPTVELIAYIRGAIVGNAIEIGAGGNGVGAALQIPMTDTREQEVPILQQYLTVLGQPPVKYPDNVEKLSARQAVRKYQPQTVVACWVTQDYRPGLEGESKTRGVDEIGLFDMGVKRYIFVGNKVTHGKKVLHFAPGIKKTEIQAPWIVSRSSSPQHNVLWIFEKY